MPIPVEKDILFMCECGMKMEVYSYDDPTTSTSCCPSCGSGYWRMYDKDGKSIG